MLVSHQFVVQHSGLHTGDEDGQRRQVGFILSVFSDGALSWCDWACPVLFEQLLGALTSRFVSVAACCRHLLSTGSIAVLTFGWQGVLRPRDMKLWQELMWELVLLPLLCIRICAEVVLPLNLIVL
jgi:hypothetical protein